MKTSRHHAKVVLLAAALSGVTMAPAVAQEKNPERNVYFGEQHVHTSWSFDAFAFGDTVTGPEEFYQYALGKPTLHPGGFTQTISKPLDWEQGTGVSALALVERAHGMELLQDKIHALQPASDSQRSLQSRALDLAIDVAQARWLVIEQQQVGLPTPLLVLLVVWLALLYATFGLFAPRNATVIIALSVCALSASASLFLIPDLLT